MPLSYAARHFDRFVSQLEEFLRIPSISTDPDHAADVRRAAAWLIADLLAIGVTRAELGETDGHPIVFAEHIVDPALPTVLVYGHYDVQPPDPLELWKSPPFQPTLRNGHLYARGASDDKGQVFMHVKAIESYLASGTPLPVNVKLLIEGEEETGSNNLAPFIRKNSDRLRADVAVISDTAMFAEGVPSITTGLRGLAYVQVEITGPNRDLHSGVYGGAVENPVSVLAGLIAGLHDENQRVTLPGFYDDVVPLSDEELRAFDAMPFDDAAWMESIGVKAVHTDRGLPIHQAVTAHPALDVNGIWGGYSGKGAKTVLPSRAGAKISARLVPNQKSERISEMLRMHFEQNAPPSVSVQFTKMYGAKPSVVDVKQPAIQAAAAAVEATTGKKPLFTREGGSIPVVADLKELLGVDTVLMGFGLNSDAIHSPNERFGLNRFRMGIDSIIRFLELYGTR